MDDDDDRTYSRAPELEDLRGLCAALGAEGARYVLIGGFAIVAHGFVRATKDIDLLVDPSVENVQRIKRAMAKLPDNAAAQLSDDDVSRYTVVRVADEIVVDLMASACGLRYEDAVAAGLDHFEIVCNVSRRPPPPAPTPPPGQSTYCVALASEYARCWSKCEHIDQSRFPRWDVGTAVKNVKNNCFDHCRTLSDRYRKRCV